LKLCTIVDKKVKCKKKHLAKGMCLNHYTYNYRNGTPYKIKRAEKPCPARYKVVVAHGHPNANTEGMILEHRLIMSTYLGRALVENENVHHINGDKRDNRIENLELWDRGQPAGQRVEDKINWAIEILKKYAPDKLG